MKEGGNLSKGLNFTPDEEKEFSELTRIHPRGIGQRLGMIADKIAHNIWMFFALLTFSVISYVFFQSILNQMLFISNTYQLVVLPVIGIASGLTTAILSRLMYRVLLEIRTEFKETRSIHRKVREDVKEIKAMHVELTDLIHEFEAKTDERQVQIIHKIDEQ